MAFIIQATGQYLTELVAQVYHSVEGLDGEVYAAVDVSQVRQLDPEGLVHRGEVEEGVGRHVVLVQGPTGLVQPDVLLRPPHGVVGPVHRDVWKDDEGWVEGRSRVALLFGSIYELSVIFII